MQSMGHCQVILSHSLKNVSSIISKHGVRQKKADTDNMLVKLSVKLGKKPVCVSKTASINNSTNISVAVC